MSWAEEQPWFGLEDLALAAFYEAEENIDEGIWVTKDSTEIAIEDMTDNHIINCVNMIKRSIRNGRPWRVKYLPLFKKELTLRASRKLLEDTINNLMKTNNKFRKLIETIRNI